MATSSKKGVSCQTPLRTGKCESSAVEWASAPSSTKYGQAAHNARHMIEWGQYPFNNKETLKQGDKGFAWHHRTPATTGTWKETFLERSLPNSFLLSANLSSTNQSIINIDTPTEFLNMPLHEQ